MAAFCILIIKWKSFLITREFKMGTLGDNWKLFQKVCSVYTSCTQMISIIQYVHIQSQ